MELRWIASSRASWAHAAAALASGVTLADEGVAERLAPGVSMLQKWLDEQGLPKIFWEHLPPLAAGIVRNDELAGVALTKTVGRDRAEGLKNWLAALLREIELPWTQQFPELTEQLALRAQPLREQWDARGAGLLRSLGNATEPGLLVERADVILVQPVLGGGGAAQVAYNSVRLEAVLANPIPELPELLRLAWLVAQLNLDLPDYRELLATATTTKGWTPAAIYGLAMLAPILTAAEDVELARFEPAITRQALAAWCGRSSDLDSVATTLAAWWETYRGARPPFAVALRALADMLA